jgi:4-hydroxy-3-methylbut-2-enyl diphosphate reductase
MLVTVAESAGFCFGVKRAVDCVYSKLKTGKVYTYGPIIHNKTVINDFSQKGVEVIESFDKSLNGEVIIRSHGVAPNVYKELKEKGISFTDCTCPFVKKIHTIVNENYKAGKKIIIIGKAAHPEIIGINGECDNTAVIIENIDEAENTALNADDNCSVVVQTTFQPEIFEKITDILEKKASVSVYNTICSATEKRQREARSLAEQVDYMIVLGDTQSSNTGKLYEICKRTNPNTYFCEKIDDLKLVFPNKDVKIGITAGASTPSVIIKEAIIKMSESFEEMLNNGGVPRLHSGEVVKGTVVGVNEDSVFVNVNYKSDGIITKSEFSDDPDLKLTDAIKVGDEIDVYVVKVNDGEGNVVLSKRKVDAGKNYEAIEKAFNEKSIVKGKIVSIVKGGLMALIDKVQVFVPSSQISNKYVDDLSVYKDKEFDFEIIEFDKSKNRIIAGRKELAKREYEEKRNKVFDSIEEGAQIEGVVSRIVDFGAFVDLGGVDGLIHISEMSWGRVKKVSDVLSEGDKVKVTVLGIDRQKGRISLSLKDVANNPWNKASEKYAVGTVVTGKVVRMVSFGAFVELEDGVDGLVHISQISSKHIAKPEDVLSIGQEITAKVTEIDVEAKKISLSIKDVEGTTTAEEE